MHSTLISSGDLKSHLDDPDWLVVDCRYDLTDPAAGNAAYLEAHIPGAVYAHLDRDLSSEPVSDRGRHPLPAVDEMARRFGALGIANDSQVVVYDDLGGAMAGRLWWMLRYCGHDAVAVLNGGWPAWQAAGGGASSGAETRAPRSFSATPRPERLVQIDELESVAQLVDARDPARYRGEVEPIDPRAGHIPGARNHFFRNNLAQDGCFLAADALRAGFQSSLGRQPDGDTVHSCGSGVSACHNILAQVVAGLPEPRLYVGSWSEWSRDPARPAATGAEP